MQVNMLVLRFPGLELSAASRADHLLRVYAPDLGRLNLMPALRAGRIHRSENRVQVEFLAAWHLSDSLMGWGLACLTSEKRMGTLFPAQQWAILGRSQKGSLLFLARVLNRCVDFCRRRKAYRSRQAQIHWRIMPEHRVPAEQEHHPQRESRVVHSPKQGIRYHTRRLCDRHVGRP
jgi:hypothetical protein